MPNQKLIIPVYLNQRIVFDMLASLEDGFAHMYSLQTSKTERIDEGKSVDAGIGVNNIFSLLSVKLQGSAKKEDSNTRVNSRSEERVHTPTSLFTTLLEKLEELNIIHDITSQEEIDKVAPGNFVRFSGRLSQNPLTIWLEAFSKIMEIMKIFQSDSQQEGGKGKNKGGAPKCNTDPTMVQIQSLLATIKSSEPYDVICKINNNDFTKAVVQVSNGFFTNKNTNEIIDGDFTILGKVVKLAHGDDPINLLRNTNLSFLNRTLLKQFQHIPGIDEITRHGIELPEMNVIISEALLIIPIAIYT